MGIANKRYRKPNKQPCHVNLRTCFWQKFPRENICCYQRVSLHDLRYLLARIVISFSVTHSATLGVGPLNLLTQRATRARNISGLHILNLNEKKVSVSLKVSEEMHRLRSQPLQPCIPSLYKQTLTNTFKIIFHNVKSLHLHHEDVASDFNVQEVDLIICVETSLCSLDSSFHYQINGFKLFRNDYCPNSNIRTCYGTAVYEKNTLTCLTTPTRFNMNYVEITVTVIKEPIPNLHIIAIYSSKNKVSLQVLINTLNLLLDALLPESSNTTPVVILGDFNVNLLEESSNKKKLQKYFQQQRQLTQIISQCTTDYHSLLDHIYTNITAQVEHSGTLESYFSDHKPIFICLFRG